MNKHQELENLASPLADGTRLAPYLVAEHRGRVRTTLRHTTAVRYLVRNGALVSEGHFGSVPGVDFYRITQRGPRFLEEA